MTVEPRPVAVDPGRSTAGAPAAGPRTPGIAVGSPPNPAAGMSAADEIVGGAKSDAVASGRDDGGGVEAERSDSGEKPDRQIADMAGDAALPRRNGELVFESAWAARAFGMTIALHEAGAFPWNDFRDRLIEEIAAAERQEHGSSYYDRWFAALERLLDARRLVTRAELEARTAEFESGRRD